MSEAHAKGNRRGDRRWAVFVAVIAVAVVVAPRVRACEIEDTLDPGAEGILQGTELAASSGATQSMSCDFIVPGPHLRVTARHAPSKEDVARAEALRARAQAALDKYEDYRAAERDGYEIRFANFKQERYHFSNPENAKLNTQSFDPARPTSLLYERTTGGYKLVGVMYTAPRWASEADLDRRFPISVAPWHLHTNFCIGPVGRSRRAGQDTRFGPNGSIATAAECSAAGGTFKPVIFGWMTHVDFDVAHHHE